MGQDSGNCESETTLIGWKHPLGHQIYHSLEHGNLSTFLEYTKVRVKANSMSNRDGFTVKGM